MSYSSRVNSLSPVGYWRLGDTSGPTATDETGSFDGTYTGTSSPTLNVTGLLTGDSDKCITLDGIDASVEIPNVGLTTATGGTFTLLFSTTTPATNNFNEILFSSYGTDDSNIIKVSVSNSGGIAIQVGSESTDIFGSGYDDGNAHHLVLLSSGAVYVDGSLIGTFTRSAPNFDVANSYSLGQEFDGTSRSDFYTGSLDEFAIFSGGLSNYSILQLYIDAKQLSIGETFEDTINNLTPIAYWRLNDTGGTAVDETATYNGTYQGGVSLSQPGLLARDSNNAVSLDGIDDYIDLGSFGSALSGNVSYSILFSTTDTGGGNLLFTAHETGYANRIRTGLGSNGEMLYAEGGTVYYFGSGYNDGNIHHAVYTMASDGTVEIYVDGSLLTTHSDGYADWALIQYSSIGQEYDGGGVISDLFEGTIDEVAFFNSILTADEVVTIYASSLGVNKDTADGNLQSITASGSADFIFNGGIGTLPTITAEGSGTAIAIIEATGDASLPLLTAEATINQPERTMSLILTGEQDNTTSYEYLLKSFSANRYDSATSQSRFTFQCPKRTDDITAYNARPNGEMILYKDGIEIFRVDPDYYSYNVGPDSETLSIKASRSYTNSSVQTLTIDSNEVSNISTGATGKRTFTIPKWIEINPLDSILYELETIQIAQVVISAKVSGWTFQLTEI